jgi:hypothetical protein
MCRMPFKLSARLCCLMKMPVEVTGVSYPLHSLRSSLSSAMANHRRLSIEQCAETVIFFAETKCVTATERKFGAVFQTQWAPARNTIPHLYSKFK